MPLATCSKDSKQDVGVSQRGGGCQRHCVLFQIIHQQTSQHENAVTKITRVLQNIRVVLGVWLEQQLFFDRS